MCRVVLVEGMRKLEHDNAVQSYDIHRQSPTGKGVALTDTNLMSLALNYTKSRVPKHQVTLEIAVVFLLSTRRHYFNARIAKYVSIFVPLAAPMCVPRPILGPLRV